MRILGSFALAMISISAIINLREFPLMAMVGWQSLGFYLIAALTFFIPSALICAELASSFPQGGGIFTWVSAAFGKESGLLAIWMEWINNVIGFPATLATIVATLVYIGFPSLAHNRLLMFFTMIFIFWSISIINSFGIKESSRINIIGAMIGTMLPCLLIVSLGAFWILHHRALALPLKPQHIMPSLTIHNTVFYIGVLSSLAGMQVTAFHAQNVRNPGRTFPRAIFAATFIIMGVCIFGSLAIAFIIPASKINMMNGVIEALSLVLTQFHLAWLAPLLAGLIAFGSIACLSAWVIAPARGLQSAAAQGLLPAWFAKLNSRKMPTSILWLQAFIATALACVFLFMPTLKSAFWILIALTSQFTLIMYVFVFASAIRLRFSMPLLARPYRIPGHNLVLVGVAGMAIISCCIGILLGIFPPQQIHWHSDYTYIALLLVIDGVIITLPFLGRAYAKLLAG